MKSNFRGILFSKTGIKNKVKELGKQITKDYKGQELIVVPILEGSMLFASDLIREIDLSLTIHSINVSSYHGDTISSGKIDMKNSMIPFCINKNVLLVDDIYDTGLTLNTLVNMFKLAGAKNIKTCVLLNKQVKRNTRVEPNYSGFKIKNEFVVGYGLDYRNFYRNLPYIGVLKDV